MSDMNLVVLIGRLGHDPETRYSPSGTCFCDMSVATSSQYKDRQTGDNVKKTQWHKVKVAGKTAERCAEYLRKGAGVAIRGEIEYRTFEGRDGQKKTVAEIFAREVNFLTRPADSGPAPDRQDTSGPGYTPPTSHGMQGEIEDDIPF